MDSTEADRRCTVFPRSADANAPSAPPASEQFFSNTTFPGERTEASNGHNHRIQKQRKDENRFDVGVKRNSQKEHQSPKRPKAPFCKNYSPWMEFQVFFAEGNPGKTRLANGFKSRGLVVAIKEYKKNGIDKTHHLVKTAHSNVVELMYAWADTNAIFLAYELMSINLEQLYSVVNLKEPDIAFICAQILHGLWYIHRDLFICHTRIQSDNIFISSEGVVKIGPCSYSHAIAELTKPGDIGASLLEQHKGSEQNDIRSVGWIIFEILAPGEADGNRRRLSLSRSTECSSNLRSFLTETETKPIDVLLEHDFLLGPQDVGCLVVPVLKAKRFVIHDYE